MCVNLIRALETSSCCLLCCRRRLAAQADTPRTPCAGEGGTRAVSSQFTVSFRGKTLPPLCRARRAWPGAVATAAGRCGEKAAARWGFVCFVHRRLRAPLGFQGGEGGWKRRIGSSACTLSFAALECEWWSLLPYQRGAQLKKKPRRTAGSVATPQTEGRKKVFFSGEAVKH